MDYLDKIDNLLNGKIYFCEIGAMDGRRHDDMYKYIQKYNWKGILVEPLGDMFQQLKINYSNKKGLIFENSAISNRNADKYLYRVPKKIIKEEKLPGWVDGISSFHKNNSEISRFNDFAIKEKIHSITFNTLVKKHGIKRIDVLQIDTEGHDYKIFKQIFPKFKPLFIKIEYKHLKKEEKSALKNILINNGYEVIRKNGDFIATIPIENIQFY